MLILDGHAQPGPDQKRCYGCGGLGHIRGDPKCTAGNKAAWKGAQKVFKKRMESGAKPQNKGGKGKGGSTQRNLGKSKSGADASKMPCHNWSRVMAFASTRKHVGTAMMALKGAILPVLLWP